jgi:hypothetical protein
VKVKKILSKLAEPAPSPIDEHEWSFIGGPGLNCDTGELLRLFHYELARESGGTNCVHANFLKLVFGDLFPKKPYLSILPEERKRLWERALNPERGVPLFNPYEPAKGLSWSFDYALEHGEPSDPTEMATAPRDQTYALVSLSIDLAFPDEKLISEFRHLLAHVRQNSKATEYARKKARRCPRH